jgi:hypothetical protein
MQTQTSSTSQVADLLAHYRDYAQNRKKFLAVSGLPDSCRDPLAEFSEILAAAVLNASKADSRVQKGYDLTRTNGRKVQVKYLCNPSRGWINEHYVYFADGVDDYALVIFEGLDLRSVIVFARESISQVTALLKKRHPNRDLSIQFTQQNYRTILARQAEFLGLGIELHQFENVQAG